MDLAFFARSEQSSRARRPAWTRVDELPHCPIPLGENTCLKHSDYSGTITLTSEQGPRYSSDKQALCDHLQGVGGATHGGLTLTGLAAHVVQMASAAGHVARGLLSAPPLSRAARVFGFVNYSFDTSELGQKVKGSQALLRVFARLCLFAFACIVAACAHSPPLQRVDHFAINAMSLGRSAAWYESVFKMKPIHKWDGVWLLGNGHLRIGIFQAPAGASRPDRVERTIGILHVAFLINMGELSQMRAILTEAKIPFREEDIGVANSIFLNDPDGHEIELIHYK